jgi:Skp family chaperone for outer membrane proteins
MRHLLASPLMLICFGLPLFAQTKVPPEAQAPAASKPPVCAAAVVNRAEFFHTERGLAPLAHGNQELYRDFQRRRDVLALLKQRRRDVAGELVRATGWPDTRLAKSEQLAALGQEIGRREQELRSLYEGRVKGTLEPFARDVEEALKAFAKERGYSLVIDAGDAPGEVLYFAESCDITREFIAAFNRRLAAAAP